MTRLAVATIGAVVIVLAVIDLERHLAAPLVSECPKAEFASAAAHAPRTDEEIRQLFEENREGFEWLRDLALTKPGFLTFSPGTFGGRPNAENRDTTFLPPEPRLRTFVRMRSQGWRDDSGGQHSLDEVLTSVGFSRAEYEECQIRLAALGVRHVLKNTLRGSRNRVFFLVGPPGTRRRVAYRDYEARIVGSPLDTHWRIEDTRDALRD